MMKTQRILKKILTLKLLLKKGNEEMLTNNSEDLHFYPTNTTAKIGHNSTDKKRVKNFTSNIFNDKEFDLKNIGLTGEIAPLA